MYEEVMMLKTIDGELLVLNRSREQDSRADSREDRAMRDEPKSD